MLSRRLIFIYLFLLFTGIFAQKYNNKIQSIDEVDDEEQPAQKNLRQPSNNNGQSQNAGPSGNTNNNRDSEQRNVNQAPVQQNFNQAPAQQNANQQPVQQNPNQQPIQQNPNQQPVQQNGNQVPVYRNVNQAPMQQKPRNSPSQSAITQLATSEECNRDVQKYCGKGNPNLISNLKVLQCVDDLDNAYNLIDTQCQDLIYKFKYNMTHDARFDDAANKQCGKDIAILNACAEHTDERGTGRLVTCLYEHLANITESSCRYFINQLQAVVFNDWRLTELFTDACMPDITKLECGRLDDGNQNLPHEQGATVSCLSQKYGELQGPCRKQIFRLAEMQSDDYHLDRALYYACRADRERLCSQTASGNGQVYRCLYEKKFDTTMSAACRKEVHRRQSLVVANVETDLPLVRACGSEMREHQCLTNPNEQDKRSSLVKLLSCLEEKLKKGYHIQDECRREMLVHRRMLMSDYALSPGIVSECKVEMTKYCPSLYQQGVSSSIDSHGGRMIHCLLSAARKKKDFNQKCLFVMNSLLRAVDPGNDIRADPLLETACRPVIDTLCPRIKPGDSNIIMCLLDNLKSSRMTEECEDRLMEVAYFMARDWRLTPRLMRTCQKSLVSLCELPKEWSMDKELSDIQVGMYLGCLYQNRQQIDSDCRTELKRLMNIRTQSIGLMPEIEQKCMDDLVRCKNPEIKGEEMKCLQQKYDTLEEECKGAVRKFTQQTMSDPSLDFLLMKACEPMIQAFCSNTEGGKENDLIHCLIKHKNEQNMDYRCKAGIDHHQITSMKDEAFLSAAFRKKCSAEVSQHCQGKKTKSSVIQCLADLTLHDVLKRQNEITEACRDELKFELLQRSESISFDPSLAKACQNDIRQYCGDRTPGNAEILDCLKENRNRVSVRCYNKLKKREKLDVVAPENDYSLMSKCAAVIQKSCSNENKQNILSCLRRNINSDVMPNPCRRVLYHRLMILNSNARFNKALIENCQSDINKHCRSEVIDNEDDDNDNDDDDDKDKDEDDANNKGNDNNNNDINDHEMGGRIIQCLRSKYVDTSVTLDSQCVTELIDVIQTSKLNVKLDVRLYQTCKKYLTEKCTGIDQEDCLKLMYQKNQIIDDACKEQIRRIIREGRADIHIDRALTFACQADIAKYCIDIPIGSGKQLQCLLGMGKAVTPQCGSMLKKRQELWNSVSDVEDVIDIADKIRHSNNSVYLLSIILLILCAMFMAGCVCRPYLRYNRVRKYK